VYDVIYRLHGEGGKATVAEKYLAYVEERTAQLVDHWWIDIEPVAKALLHASR
jgi:hypothetical protein